MHLGKYGIVPCPKSEFPSRTLVRGAGIDRFHCCYEIGVMSRCDLLVCRRSCRDIRDMGQSIETKLSDVVIGQEHAFGTQGMARTEIVEATDVADRDE